MRKITLIAVLAAAPFFSTAARADTDFTLTSLTDGYFYQLTFTLPSTPTPDSYDAAAGVFTVPTTETVYGFDGDNDPAITPVELTFFTNDAGGGVFDYTNFDANGRQLFTGTVESPTFKDGSYAIDQGDFHFFLDVTSTGPASTPEPSSLILLGTGALGLAGAARRRVQK